MPPQGQQTLYKTRLAIAPLLFWASGALAEALSIGVRGYLVQQEVFSLFAAPGEEVRLELATHDTGKLRLQLDGQAFGEAGPDSWTLTAPTQPGVYTLELEQLESDDYNQKFQLYHLLKHILRLLWWQLSATKKEHLQNLLAIQLHQIRLLTYW